MKVELLEAIKWTDELQAYCAIAMVILTGVGFLFLNLQLKDAAQTHQITTYENIYSRMHDIHKLFLENTELRGYFYDGWTTAHADPQTLKKLTILAEMMADFFQQIHLQLGMMTPNTAKGWRNYMSSIMEKSPILCTFFQEHKDWYPSRFIAIPATGN